jgi:hypothetical protein
VGHLGEVEQKTHTVPFIFPIKRKQSFLQQPNQLLKKQFTMLTDYTIIPIFSAI